MHFLDKSRLKTRHTHCGRCAPAGGATHGTVPPGCLCTLQVGPGSAAGCAQPALCQLLPSEPLPSCAPAPAAGDLVCSRLRTTFRDKVRPKRCYTMTFGHQIVRCEVCGCSRCFLSSARVVSMSSGVLFSSFASLSLSS